MIHDAINTANPRLETNMEYLGKVITCIFTTSLFLRHRPKQCRRAKTVVLYCFSFDIHINTCHLVLQKVTMHLAVQLCSP